MLRELLSLTGLQTGWIFLIEPDGSYTLAASAYLPPALGQRENALMCSGECYCLTKFSNGGLTKAVNIMNCKRIEFAEQTTNCRDTEGITHHATVPLEDGGRKFGLLNVAASEKNRKQHLIDGIMQLLRKSASFHQQGVLLLKFGQFHPLNRRSDLKCNRFKQMQFFFVEKNLRNRRRTAAIRRALPIMRPYRLRTAAGSSVY